jgi:hypothetical protein
MLNVALHIVIMLNVIMLNVVVTLCRRGHDREEV